MRTLIVLLCLFPISMFGQERENIESTLEVLNIHTGNREIIYREKRHFEAPNWSGDGKFFIVNSNGKLYKIYRKKGVMEEIFTDFAQHCNNDHGISPDGKQLVISHHRQEPNANRGSSTSTIYILPITGGTPRKITDKTPSYWHGWSPDGKTLVYVGEREREFDIYSISVNGGKETRLTYTDGLDDGPEYSPDGKYIYYNSYRSGHMEIWRMNADGSNPLQLTNDAYANWFPHPSPDGKYIVFLSYINDQKQSHPFGKDVKLRLMDLNTREIRNLTNVFFGGQGTINVPSWSPDSQELAFVSFKLL